jgi:hypothetical protein
MVEIEWAPAGAGTEELELLLSLDGGRTWHLRVSPELPGESVRYRWRVPNLAAADARVRLRVRRDEREIELPAGDSFTIECDPTRPAERRLVSEGPWWDGLEGAGEAAPTVSGSGGPSLVAGRSSTASEDAPRLAMPVPTMPGVRLDPRDPEARSGSSPGNSFTSPWSQPLRN